MIISCGTKKKVSSHRNSSKTTQTTSNEIEKVDPKTKDESQVENQTKQEKTPKTTDDKPAFSNPVEAYIWQYSGIAQEEMRLYGIPASITIAQGILESGSGQGNLTTRSNNHFGIKCNGWEGEKVYHDDDELQECFRKYKDPKYSFRDHSLFLYERPRYAFLFDYKITDYKAWAKGLRRAGYATDRKYPDKLISLIERFHLHELDAEVVNGTPPPNFPKPKNKVDTTTSVYYVKAGDTLYKISTQFNLTVDELKQLNQLESDNLNIGQKLYLKPLNKK
ncbi:glucosaminidase domain-containing protein [Psychroflexus planctonicus]|uniref:Peptidoglycan hydrolase n=1 Tax=Psychroflexus planctonicus TaxID=1526575 RepID=A0ABQ1SJC3_9FLAO|nr:glucosaminidase domain-containing protein [Psychroflexus planctonicus]GGE42869.1 hemagglutinin [Psychroflexus planctonicus]